LGIDQSSLVTRLQFRAESYLDSAENPLPDWEGSHFRLPEAWDASRRCKQRPSKFLVERELNRRSRTPLRVTILEKSGEAKCLSGMQRPASKFQEAIFCCAGSPRSNVALAFVAPELMAEELNAALNEPFCVGRDAARLLFDFAVMLSAFGDHENNRVLDFRCGTGWVSEFLCRAGFEVTGIDIDANAEDAFAV
jgi:hypothetical protein